MIHTADTGYEMYAVTQTEHLRRVANIFKTEPRLYGYQGKSQSITQS